MSQEGYPHYNQNFNARVEQNMGYRDCRSTKSANRKKTKPNPKRPDKKSRRRTKQINSETSHTCSETFDLQSCIHEIAGNSPQQHFEGKQQ